MCMRVDDISVDLERRRTTLRVPRSTGKTRITGKTAEIPERPNNDRELKYAVHLVMY